MQETRARRVTPDLALACVGVTVTAYILITTLIVVQNGYSPLPYADGWNFWRSRIFHGNYTAFLFNQHVEHRIAVPRLFFIIDRFVFHARNLFPLICSLLAQAATGVWLYKMARRTGDFSQGSLVLLGCAIGSALFSAQQFPNLVQEFQIATTMLYCAFCGSILALLRTSEGREEGLGREFWFAVCCVSALVATYSSANGLFSWPILVLLAVWLRLPLRFRLALAVNMVLATGSYLRGYYTPPGFSKPLEEVAQNLTSVFLRAAMFLGSPSGAIHASIAGAFGPLPDGSRAALAAACGFVGMAAAFWALLRMWRRHERFTKGHAALVHVVLFVVLTAGLVGIGRATPAFDVMTERYQTHALVFWIALGAFYWASVERRLRALTAARLQMALSAIVLCPILTLAFRQPFWIQYSKGYAESLGQAEAAIVSDVYDPPVWQWSFPSSGPLIFGSVGYLRQNRLSVFTEAWTTWAGQPVGRLFRMDRDKVCLGYFDSATPVISSFKPGWLVTGWGWDIPRQIGPETVILVDPAQRIAGVARNILDRLDVRQVIPEVHSVHVGWRGYVAGSEPVTLAAYLLEHDGHSLCGIGSPLTLPRAGGQAVQ
jgi:hypothetical protein